MTNRNCLTCKYRAPAPAYGYLTCAWLKENRLPQALAFKELSLKVSSEDVHVFIGSDYQQMNCPAWQPKEGGE